MMPILPDLTVRPLQEEDAARLQALLAPALERAIYSRPMSLDDVLTAVLSSNPPTVYPVRWQRTLCLGAWRAGQLLGCADIAVGLDSDRLDLPDYQPVGLLRFLVLPDRDDLGPSVAAALLAAAEVFWRSLRVGHIKAFHRSTGYPAFQGGAGLLPGDWTEHFRLLTAAGFGLVQRYYCLRRVLATPIEETTPLADLSLAYRGDADDRRYELFYRRTEWVGRARLVRVALGDADDRYAIAYLTDLEIEARWRHRNLGRWLLRRLINDATLSGARELMVHVALKYSTALNLLTQHGFEELDYRGYELEKVLSQ